MPSLDEFVWQTTFCRAFNSRGWGPLAHSQYIVPNTLFGVGPECPAMTIVTPLLVFRATTTLVRVVVFVLLVQHWSWQLQSTLLLPPDCTVTGAVDPQSESRLQHALPLKRLNPLQTIPVPFDTSTRGRRQLPLCSLASSQHLQIYISPASD